ncbi:MAG: hypothetical protein GY835_01310 [bacterium]|nr:hypothetical protein [bacterium]
MRGDFHRRYTSFRLWILPVLILLVGPRLLAQMPGQQLDDGVMRLLEREPRGTIGDLTTSQAVLYMYDYLEVVFHQSLREVQDARRIADRYRHRMPKSRAEWGQYVDALKKIQSGRERYQQTLRELISNRRSLIDRLLGPAGLIRSTGYEVDRTSAEQSAELGAVAEVQRQILQQQTQISHGQIPTIQWPSGIDSLWKAEITQALKDAAQGSSNAYDAWRALDRRLGRLLRDLEATADVLRESAQQNWDNLEEMEKQAIAEFNVLAEAQVDLASNAMLQQSTIRRIYRVQQTYAVWKVLN